MANGITKTELELTREVRKLSDTIRRLSDEQPFSVMTHPLKFAWYSFVRGVLSGFGAVIGATLVVAIVIYLLSTIQFVPFLGDTVKKIIEYLQTTGVR